ncbi:peroxiredoxin [Brevundimonas sp. 2R-24]|uniref:thioredoxin-dependent peroxiredoxin n=1 Tax=Peiella sedimenti TaxID=3061083 RepID=A0ABT8SK47_9CAUL|nr:peroxiredoxin [Caulobacteraceae bacterium XZ-24]
MSGPAEGDRAPDFDMPTDGGARVRLTDLAGKPLVLYFYPKDDTPGCTREAQEFSSLAAEFARAGAAVVGVSRDTAKKHDRFKAKYDLNLTLGADEEGLVTEAYGVWVEKSMYGRKYMGIERATFLIGPDGRVARVWRKVSVPNHAQEVLDALQQLPVKHA